jgi:DNA-binding transcriptional ArsR family regulator
MAQSTPIRRAPSGNHRQRAEAVLDLHLLALKRQFEAIRKVFGDDPPHRSREALWAILEVLRADLRSEKIAIRDLVARAGGLLSAPTMSRTVAELEQCGLLTATMEGRLKLLKPTLRADELLMSRADEAFLAFASITSGEQRHSVPACPAEQTLPETSREDLPEGPTRI